MDIEVKSFNGGEAKKYVKDLAELRIEIFREYPYLYNGNIKSEKEYLSTFIDAKDSVLVLAFDGDKVIGASTGLPMEQETENVQKPWKENGFDLSKIFYFGESVLKNEYRGKGIGVKFFEHREKWAALLNRFDMFAFCGVIRPDDHPLRPKGWQPLDLFWQKRGYRKTDDYICEMLWQEIGQSEETPKKLLFWQKKLNDKGQRNE